eukprot:1369019-Amorphochlora_amoeboformis.AAC.2
MAASTSSHFCLSFINVHLIASTREFRCADRTADSCPDHSHLCIFSGLRFRVASRVAYSPS